MYDWNKENERRNANDLEALKKLIGKYKKQNDALINDMHRINE